MMNTVYAQVNVLLWYGVEKGTLTYCRKFSKKNYLGLKFINLCKTH